jgi:hypothetical protein
MGDAPGVNVRTRGMTGPLVAVLRAPNVLLLLRSVA